MPGNAIVAATDAMLTTAHPRPAGQPGAMARPRAPPVTKALRPVRSYTLMWHLLLETAPIRTGLDVAPRCLSHCAGCRTALVVAPPPSAAVRRRSHCHAILTVVKTFLDACQVLSCSWSAAQDTVGSARKTR